MLNLATFKVLEVYGIAIMISMFVAMLIKIMVIVTCRARPHQCRLAQHSHQTRH